ncbi:hypothetical protein [Bradyrhizobium sp. USDA 4454]
MQTTPDRETQRLDVLAELDMLDTPHELAFDRLAGQCRKTMDSGFAPKSRAPE